MGDPIATLGLIATCSKCAREVTSYGNGRPSRARCCVLLSQACGKGNFYEYDPALDGPLGSFDDIDAAIIDAEMQQNEKDGYGYPNS